MKNLFNSVKMFKPKVNRFDLSHDVKLSCNMGNLVPTMLLECVPGDKFNISCDSLLRFAPMVSPVMHRMDVYMHYFFVPNRVLWPNWENYITNTPVGGNLPAFPTVGINQIVWDAYKTCDYMGLPRPGVGVTNTVSAIPFAAYQKIYDEYYRDQNLFSALFPTIELLDGDNTVNVADLTIMRKRAWEHDYFTAALPFAQKGDAVDLPLGQVSLNPDWRTDGDEPVFRDGLGAIPTGPVNNNDPASSGQINVGATAPAAYDPDGSLEVDPTTINDLRRAFRLQEWLEKAARGGSRYVENILAHFGVKSSDRRLQRPEYITGSKSPVIVSEVLNTTGTNDAPQGNMAGHGVAVTKGNYGYYRCEEHGYIIGIMSVMPRTAYQQGIPRHFMKTTDPFEFFWPSFANIGEQPVWQAEVWSDTAAPKGTFGYVPRYAEYKFMQNRVAGDFRDTLDFWHLGRIFASEPALNQTFIECDPSFRIFAVTDDTIDHLYVHVLHKINAIRSMPKFGTPTF